MRFSSCYFATFLFTISLSAQTLVDGHIVSPQSTGTNNATNDYIHIYQNHISNFKGSRCAMYPSCSNYGLMVYSDKNFFEGTTLLCDRLIRCSQDRKFYNTTHEYGYSSLSDIPYYKKDTIIAETFPRAEILKTAKDTALLFINHLMNEKEYSSALLEIERLHFTRKSLSPTLYLKKFQCLRGLGRHEKALYEYETNTPTDIKNTPEIIFEAAKTNYLLTNYPATIELTQKINSTTPLFTKARTLQALSLAREKNYDESKNIFTKLSTAHPEEASLKSNIATIDKLINSKEKKPAIARILSIIPGAGYLYAGHKGSAATSLFINSLLVYATYTSIKNENYGVAGVMGFFSLSFYIGNISGAGRSAKRHNEKNANNIISEIERNNNIINY